MTAKAQQPGNKIHCRSR